MPKPVKRNYFVRANFTNQKRVWKKKFKKITNNKFEYIKIFLYDFYFFSFR